MDDGREIVDPQVGVPGISDIGSPGDVLTYLGPNFVPRFRPVTGAGLGNVTGPATTTVDFVPQWNNTTGTLLKNGLPVSITGAASSLVETDAGGKIAAGVIPNSGVTPGTYTYSQITVGLDGRLTAASSGAAPGITADAPAGPTVYGRNTGNWVAAVPLAGGTMTGPLVLSGPPSVPNGAASKGYVDTAVAGLAPLNSPFFTGTPTAPTQATGDNSTRLATTAFIKSLGYSGTNQTITLSGDVTGSGTTAIAATLATVNSSPGTFQGLTVNAKGLVTAAADQGYLTAVAASYLPLAGGTIGPAAPAALVIQRNTAPLPPDIPNTALRINFADTDIPYVLLDGYGIYPNIVLRTSSGTGAAPLYVEENDIIGVVSARGYAGAGYSATGTGRLVFRALEDYTATAQGTSVAIETMPVGSASVASRLTQIVVGPGLTVGPAPAPAGGMLVGDINAGGRIMINGVPVATTGGVAGAFLPLAGGVISGVSPGTLYIQRGTAMPAVPAQVNPILWLAGRNTGGALGAGEVATIVVDSINELSGIVMRRANGTGTSAVASGDVLGQIAVRGYGTTQYSPGGNARLQFRAAEAFTDNFQGTTIRLQTTPVGDNVLHDQVIIGPGLIVGTPTPPADGMHIGDINGSRILLNGVPVTSVGGGGGPTTLAGDVTGASTATTVAGLQSRPLAATAPLSGQVIGWDGTQWLPVAAITGSGGPPGGATGTVQINNGGSFGGIAMTGDATWNTTTTVLNLANTTTARTNIGLGTTSTPTFASVALNGATAFLNINRNTAALPPPLGNSSLWVNWGDVGVDPTPNFVLDAHGVQATLAFRMAGGSGASPSATTSGAALGNITWRGFDTAYSTNPNALLSVVSAETANFTSGGHGTQLQIHTTQVGQATLTPQMTVGPLGMLVGSPTAAAVPAVGDVNAKRFLIDGTPISTGGSGSGVVGSGTGPQLAQYPAGTGTTVAGVTLSGDATIAAGGALTIGAGRVTLAMMQSRSAATLLGNPTGGSATPVEILLGSGLAFSAGALTATGGATGIAGLTAGQIPIAGSAITITSSANLSGHVVSAPTTLVTTIQPQVVTHAMMVNVAALRLIGNPTVGATSRSEISLGTGLSFAGTVLNGAVGTVTSVGLTMPGSIFGVGGSPVTTGAGTLAVTVAGTSGGVPYFSSGTAMGTSGALTQHGVVIGGGPGNPPVTTAVGSTGQVLTGVTGGDPVWQAPPAGGVVASALSTVPYYNTTATVTGNPTITSTTAGALTLNASTGTATPPAVSTGPLQLVGANGSGPSIEMYSFASTPIFAGYAAGGTVVTPLVTPIATVLVGLTGFGYTGAAYTGQRGSVQVLTSEAWTTNRGTSVVINTTPTGTTGPIGTCATFNAGLVMGAATGGDKGAGTINISGGFYVNNSLIGGGADTTATLAASAVNPAITTQFVNVTPVAAGHGVTLPTGSPGTHCIVRNSGANTLNVLPISTAQINIMGNGVAISVPVNSTAYFEAQSAIQWFSVP